jgi:integrating conjugative element protein (TIGR03759 family)
MNFQHVSFLAGLPLMLAMSLGAHAQQSNVARTLMNTSEAVATRSEANGLTEADKVAGQIWGLSTEEMGRVKLLMKGPRGAFSVGNISPIEVLGIHAKSDAERTKYAEMFAKAFHADVERSLAWNKEFYVAMARLYPNEPVYDYRKALKVDAPVGSADVAGVPRFLLKSEQKTAAPARK